MNNTGQFLMNYGGAVLFAIVFAEQAGLPLPSAPWLLAAGALSASGKLSPALAIGVTALAAIMADSLWFYVGRRGGQRVLRPFCRLSLSCTSCVGRTKGLFVRHGFQALVAAKFLPGLGLVMPPLAGALGMSTGRFLLFDGLGSLFYGTFYIAAGFLFRNQLSQAMALLNRLGLSALLLALVVVTGYIAFKYVRRRRLINGGKHRVSIATQEGGASVERASVTIGNGYRTAANASADSLNGVELQNVGLALTNSAPQNAVASGAATLVSYGP
jgi:membrane protein DedA with SNARE-associated domain